MTIRLITLDDPTHGLKFDGSNDAPAWNALMADIEADGGAQLILPKKATIIEDPVIYRGSDLTIVGGVFVPKGNGGLVFGDDTHQSQRIRLEAPRFVADGGTPTFVRAQNVSGLWVTGFQFENSWRAFKLGTLITPAKHVHFTDINGSMSGSGHGDFCSLINMPGPMTVMGGHIEGSSNGLCFNFVSRPDGFQMSNITLRLFNNLIRGTAGSANMHLDNVFFDGWGSTAVHMPAETGSINGLHIVNSHFQAYNQESHGVFLQAFGGHSIEDVALGINKFRNVPTAYAALGVDLLNLRAGNSVRNGITDITGSILV